MKESLSIIGAGAWGSALAIALSNNFKHIYLHAHTEAQVKNHPLKHPALPVNYPNNVALTLDTTAIGQATAILIAVPSYGFTQTLRNIKPLVTADQPMAWLTKGFDTEQQCLLHQSFETILTAHTSCIISGPSFAFEVAAHKPTAVTVASKRQSLRNYWAGALQTKALRAYTSDDVVGVEVGGSVKNILAIAAGIAAGLGYGSNTQAALITRGLAEMVRFGLALGANKTTFSGLSGLGDLVLTCSDDLSRNRRFGQALSKQQSVVQALETVGATVEGLNTLELVLSMAKQHQIELPICEHVLHITQGKISADEALRQLMSRQQTDE